MTIENTIESTFSKYLAWFKSHERLVLLLAAGFFAVHFYGKGLDFLVKHDQTQAQIATQQALIAATKVSTDDTANKLLLSQLSTLQQQVAQSNQRIDQAISQRAAQTTNQKHVDDNMQSAELATRTQSLIGVGTIKVNAPLGDELIFSLDAAHANLDKLEDLGQAQADLKDVNTKLVSCQSITVKQTDTINGLNGQITDGKTALTTEQNSHAKDVKKLELEKKRSWLSGFKWGVITGVVGTLFVHKP